MILSIKTSSYSYQVHFTNDTIKSIESHLNVNQGIKSISIITDSNLKDICKEIFFKIKRVFSNVKILYVESGEESKNINTVMDLAHELLAKHGSRSTLFIGIGGGVVGDLAGFLSAIYMRGVPLINIPTTLLAMVDSSIGGKNAIDTSEGKNLLGTFKHPELVIINQNFLNSLPVEELINGMAEVIKYGLISDRDFLKYIENNIGKIFKFDKDVIADVIYKSCKIKSEFILDDPYEMGKRKILNFGHSIGHVIENLSNYKISHGHAISIGMIFDLWFSSNYSDLDTSVVDNVRKLLLKFGLMTDIPHDFSTKNIISNLEYDKKANENFIDYIILEDIGVPKILNIGIRSELEDALNEYRLFQSVAK